jgi:WD40 repeat protein
LQATFSGHQDTINSVSFSPDSQLLASASDDHTVRLWTRDGKLLKKLDHNDKVNSVSFSADGQVLASASDDHTVKLWTREGKFLKQLNHGDKVNAVSFSPVGNLLASASDDKTVKLWNQDGQAFKSPLQHSDKVTNIKFSPDGKLLASITQDNKIKLWQTSDENAVSLIHEDASFVVFNPDNTILATTNLHLQSYSVIYFSMLHWMWNEDDALYIQGSLSDLQFSPDRTLLAAATDSGLQIVDFDLNRLLIKACGLARNYLQNNQNIKDSDRHLCDDIPTSQ